MIEIPCTIGASESPGGAVGVAENIGGGTGQELLQAAQDALSWGTAAAYLGALIVGVGTMVILRGLRGVEMPPDDQKTPAQETSTPEMTLSTSTATAHSQIAAKSSGTAADTRRKSQ